MAAPTLSRDEALDRRRLEALVEALRAGRYEDGVAQAEAALADGLIHPLPLRLAATVRQRAGRFEEAIALFQRAVELAPRDPHGWAALAACLFAARRPQASLDASDAALKLAPDEPALLCGRAQVLQSLGRIEEAAGLYRQALQAQPDLFEAGLGLTTLAVEAEAWDEAGAYVVGLKVRHGPHPALIRLAAKIAMGQDDFETARAEVSALLDDSRLPPEQRAEALLLRGEALDALDRTTEAFHAAMEGKALQHRLLAERAAGHESETDKLRRLADWFRGADPAHWRSSPASAPGAPQGHVFLVGFPRSGATLLEQVLAGYPEVAGLEEETTLVAAYAEFMTTDEDLQRLARLSPTEASLWRARYWSQVRAQGVEPNGKLFIDKAPAGALYLPLIAKLFPRAKVLFALRDPRDVVLSCLVQNLPLNATTSAFTTLADTAACYDAWMALADIYSALLPLDMMQTRHEALVEDFDASLAKIAGFLGLDITPQMADVVATAARGLGRWRAYARHMRPVMATLAPWAERFGYPAD